MVKIFKAVWEIKQKTPLQISFERKWESNSSKCQINFLKYRKTRNRVNFLTSTRKNFLYITIALKSKDREITVRQ